MNHTQSDTNDLENGDVPDGWSWAEFREIASITGGITKGQKRKRSAALRMVPYLRVANVQRGYLDLTEIKEIEATEAEVQALALQDGDLLLIEGGNREHLGRGWIWEGQIVCCIHQNHVFRARLRGGLEPRFFSWYANYAGQGYFFAEASQTVNLASINLTKLSNVPMIVPPSAEQKRIVAKVEELLARVNAARERLAKVPAILKRFRQSILASACSGQLTAEWRKGRSLEPSDQLVTRLRTLPPTKTELADEFPVKRWRVAAPRHPDLDHLPSIPETWAWVYLPNLGYLNRGRSRNRPRNAPHLYGGKYPFIQTGDIAQSGGRIAGHKQTYSEAGLAQSRLWPAGTICITIAANIADSALLTYPACFPDSVVGLITDSELCVPEFAEFFLRTAREDLSQFAPATAQKNINIGILGEVTVPLPPLEEQHEIVRRVDALFALADKIEARVQAATARVEKLTQAILAKAFRGELVPTEAELARQEGRDYEPASALLERIRASRDNGNGQSPKPPSRRPRKPDPTPQPPPTLFQEPEAPPESSAPSQSPPPIDQTDRDDVMAIIREVFSAGGPRSRQQAIHDIARALGYERVGSRIDERLDDDIRAAVRRGILDNSPDGLRLLCRTITDYQRDFLIEQLLAGMGTSWWERESLITGTARFLGFRRTGQTIRDTLKSAINGAIRRGLLEYEGSKVRKAR